jgi:hypothetical protein
MHRHRAYIGAVAGFFVLAGAIVLTASLSARSPRVDPLLARTFAYIQTIGSYAQNVQTEASINGQKLRIVGTYLVDDQHGKYAFVSTTTLTATGQKPVTFTLDNISIGSDVYSRVDAPAGTHLSVPASTAWHRFRADGIPPAFTNIAIAGPLVDNLKIFGNSGAYLALEKKDGVEHIGGSPLTHYTFALSPAGTRLSEGPLGVVAGRIGQTGTIDVWLTSDGVPVVLVFTGAGYVSTTTVSRINGSLQIAAPPGDF